MRQTTVLIAQLSTTAGIRAPLAHMADQVFVELSRELERQGVRQKVVADMFGIALRTYQRKVTRLMADAGEQGRTLWEVVFGFIGERAPATRSEIEHRFRREDGAGLAAVLRDLVASGLVYKSGDGADCLYGPTSSADRSSLSQRQTHHGALDFTWLAVFHHGPLTSAELAPHLPYDASLVDEALGELVADGRVAADGSSHGAPRYRCARITVPVGSEQGWEAAVLDHFQAVVRAIGAKLQAGTLRSDPDDTVGGATVTFDIYPGHPMEAEVRGLLGRVRAEVNTLWDRVEAHNAEHPVDPARLDSVPFYFGQGAPLGRLTCNDSEDRTS